MKENRPSITAWLELRNNKDAIDAATAGIDKWAASNTLDSVILSVNPADVGVFERMLPTCQARGIRLIPGIEIGAELARIPDSKFRQAADVVGWQRSCSAIAHAVAITGSATVAIDIESVVKGYVLEGGNSLNVGGLAECFALLPANLRLIVYPTIESGQADRRERQATTVRLLLQAHRNVEFVDCSMAKPALHFGAAGKINREAMVGLNAEFYHPPRLMHRMLWLYGRKKYWDFDEGAMLLHTVEPPDSVILYPGARRWVECADVMVPLLMLGGYGRS